MSQTKPPFEVKQTSSATWTGYIKDASGAAIASADIDSMTMTLYDKSSGEVINDREDQSILDENDVTVHATSGLVTWELQPEDNIIVSTTLEERKAEEHIALVIVTYDTSKKLIFEIPINVINVEKVSNPA